MFTQKLNKIIARIFLKDQNSLVKIYTYSMMTIATVIISAVFFLFLINEIIHQNEHIASVKGEYLLKSKKKLKSEVDNAVKFIDYKINSSEKRLKEDIKERTYEAWNTASYIYKKNKNRSKGEIASLIHDALHAASWDEGRGYYFAEDLKGYERINRNNPELIGKNINHLRDNNGVYIMRDIIKTVKGKKREGYVRYYWNSPLVPGKQTAKISFVKYFKPLDWVIGTGKYLDNEFQITKKEVISYIESIRFQSNNYIFIGDWAGTAICGPNKGKNSWDVTDPNGVKIVQELITISKNGGGYLEYVMPKFKGTRPVPKLSYTRAITNWQWYVGAGMYIDEIDSKIEMMEYELKRSLVFQLIKLTILYLAAVAIIFFIIRFITSRLKSNLLSFSSFFSNSFHTNETINMSDIYFEEFLQIAEYANKMVGNRKKTEENLRNLLKEKDVLIQDIHHRVKNNLAVIYSLIEMEKDRNEFLAPEVNRHLTQFCDNISSRIKTIGMIYTFLYQRDQSHHVISCQKFFDQFIEMSKSMYDTKQYNVKFEVDVDDIFLTVDKIIPLALIVNEILSNSFKYAFKENSAGELWFSIKEDGKISVIYEDDGSSFNFNDKLKDGRSLGIQLISLLSKQLKADLTVPEGNRNLYKLDFIP